jgi:hypothetical protein
MSKLFALSLFLISVFADEPIRRDICIAGAGASGMATAFMAKDNGYSVVVLERRGRVGGHCRTTHFTPAFPGGPSTIDYAVQLFPDTRVARETFNFFPFRINTTDIVKRFAGNDSISYVNFSAGTTGDNPSFLVDVNAGIKVQLPPPGPQSTAFQIALGTFFNLLKTQYPWLSCPGWPDPIPSELLVTMDQWMTANNFVILQPLFSQLTDNLGPYNEVLAVYALGIISPIVINFFFPNPVPTAFNVAGGCSKIYDGISTYLGAGNVVLNAQITEVQRKSNDGNHPIQLRGKDAVTGEPFKYFCGDVVIAFPQTLANLADWDLDDEETAIFSQIGVRNYWWGTANISGQQTSGGFSVQLRTLTGDPFQSAPYPGLLQVMRPNVVIPPAAWYAASGVHPLTDAEIAIKVQNHFNTMISAPISLFDSVAITEFHRHQYQPHVTNVTALAVSPNLYKRISNLQGHRHTYYVGATEGYAGSFIVWENSYRLVQTYFPA